MTEKLVYEMWSDGKGSITFTQKLTKSQVKKWLDHGLFDGSTKCYYSIKASSWAEACAAHHEIQGWGPYKP